MGLSPFIVNHISTVRHDFRTDPLAMDTNMDMDVDMDFNYEPTEAAGHVHQPQTPTTHNEQVVRQDIPVLKRSPHSDPGPSPMTSQTTPSAPLDRTTQPAHDKEDPTSTSLNININQWTVILDAIRSNLNLIVATWGRESRQYNEARGVMVAYLEENLGRLRRREGESGAGGDRLGGSGSVHGESGGRDGDHDDDDEKIGARIVERGIEELMGELRI